MEIQDTRTKERLEFAVDPEHSALRFSVVGLFVLVWIITYFVTNLVLPTEGLNLIAVIASFIITAVLMQQVERILKARWPSGRKLIATTEHIRLQNAGDIQQEIMPDQQVNVMLWRFKINKRSRIPKGWYVIACALEQEDIYLPFYTFVSPEDMEQFNSSGSFKQLINKKQMDHETTSGQMDMRLAGEQRRLHTAETARWMHGAEMRSEDFQQLLGYLQTQFPGWMPTIRR